MSVSLLSGSNAGALREGHCPQAVYFAVALCH